MASFCSMGELCRRHTAKPRGGRGRMPLTRWRRDMAGPPRAATEEKAAAAERRWPGVALEAGQPICKNCDESLLRLVRADPPPPAADRQPYGHRAAVGAWTVAAATPTAAAARTTRRSRSACVVPALLHCASGMTTVSPSVCSSARSHARLHRWKRCGHARSSSGRRLRLLQRRW